MSRRPLAGLGRRPRDPPALLELHHVVLTEGPLRQPHDEDVAHGLDALAGVGPREVVVAVPARLLRRVGNQLEDPFGGSVDLADRADDPRSVVRGPGPHQ